MEIVKEWALSLTVTCIVTAVLSYVTPSGKFEKSVKVFISLFLLIAFFAPIAELDTDSIVLKENEGIEKWISESALETKVKNEVIQVLEQEIKAKISAFLNQRNISFTEIIPDISIDGNDNISIMTIHIVVSKDVDRDIIEDFVLRSFGIIPQIVINSGDNYG